MSFPKIALDTIEDEKVRKALQTIQDYLVLEPLLASNFAHLEIEVDRAVTSENYRHNLGFTPRDAVITYDSAGTTLNYDSFDEEFINFTTTGAGTLRVYLGRKK